MYYNKSNKAKEEMKMIKTIELLLDEKGMLDGILPVKLNGQTHLIEVEFLLEKAAELSDERIELHANRLMKEDFNNKKKKLNETLKMMESKVLQKKKGNKIK